MSYRKEGRPRLGKYNTQEETHSVKPNEHATTEFDEMLMGTHNNKQREMRCEEKKGKERR